MGSFSIGLQNVNIGKLLADIALQIVCG